MNLLKRLKHRNIVHHCFTCDWFKMTMLPDGKTGNRFCKYPGKLTWKHHVCQNWVLAEDIEKRSLNIYGVVT